MNDKVLYGVDCGSKRFFVSTNKGKGKPFSKEEFLSFDWYVGPGTLVTETTTLQARPQFKTPSLAQFLTFKEVTTFLGMAEMHGLEVLVYPNRDTYKLVNTFVELMEKQDPRVSEYETDGLVFQVRNNKKKSDVAESMILAFATEICPQSLSSPSILDPDSVSSGAKLIKERIIADSNRRLNLQRVTDDYKDPDFCKLGDLVPAIKEEMESSQHPGAAILREIDAMPAYKVNRGEIVKGDVKKHEMSPAFKAVYAVKVKEDGSLRGCGFQMVWQVLGGNAFRFKSGVAGAQLRHDVHGKLREYRCKQAGLTCKDNGSAFVTRDPHSPYYSVQRQCHKDLKNVVKFLNQTYEKLLN